MAAAPYFVPEITLQLWLVVRRRPLHALDMRHGVVGANMEHGREQQEDDGLRNRNDEHCRPQELESTSREQLFTLLRGPRHDAVSETPDEGPIVVHRHRTIGVLVKGSGTLVDDFPRRLTLLRECDDHGRFGLYLVRRDVSCHPTQPQRPCKSDDERAAQTTPRADLAKRLISPRFEAAIFEAPLQERA